MDECWNDLALPARLVLRQKTSRITAELIIRTDPLYGQDTSGVCPAHVDKILRNCIDSAEHCSL